MKHTGNHSFPAGLCIAADSQSRHTHFLLSFCHSAPEFFHSSSPVLFNQYTTQCAEWRLLCAFPLLPGILQAHPCLVRMQLKLFPL